MENPSTKVLPNQPPPNQWNRILPNEGKKDLSYFEGGPKSEEPDVNEIEGILRYE